LCVESLRGLSIFPLCPVSFENYSDNADWLDQSLLELLYLDYSLHTLVVQHCRAD
jgi:hypothetical protein